MFKFLRKLLVFVLVIVVLVLVYRHYKPQIAGFLLDKGINIPGVTDDIALFPTSETVVDENGNVSVSVNLPPAYTQSITQEHLDEMIRNSEGRLTASRNEDGSISIMVTEAYRDEILQQMSSYYDQSVINTLIGGKVLRIEHNDDYTVFTVTCEQGMSETEILTLTGKLFAVGKLYSSFAGHNDANICVVLVDSVDSSVSNTYVSDNIGDGIASDAQRWAGDAFDNAVSEISERFESIT